ncbi:MAG TPA: PASTA domain-containing protein [Terriglobales bacterium]|nr:PASTA domain-containing protein [Terriglobales bacterium]
MDWNKLKSGFLLFIHREWPKRIGILILAFLFCLLVFDQVLMPFLVRLGQESVVPNITGLTQDEAEAILKDKGLNLRVIGEEYDLKKPVGTIISQVPDSSSRVKRGRMIKVVLSKGGEKATVPNLRGMSYRQAEVTLDNRGLKIGNPVYVSVDSLPRDEIIASFPSAGTVVPLGMEIRVLINQEQADTLEIVKVPKFKGENIKEVNSEMEKIGLKLGKVEYKVKNKLLPGTVLKQIPKEGAEVRKGSIVELEVSTTD